MTSIVALYRGENVDDLELVAASRDPLIVRALAKQLLDLPVEATDRVRRALEIGRRAAVEEAATEADLSLPTLRILN